MGEDLFFSRFWGERVFIRFDSKVVVSMCVFSSLLHNIKLFITSRYLFVMGMLYFASAQTNTIQMHIVLSWERDRERERWARLHYTHYHWNAYSIVMAAPTFLSSQFMACNQNLMFTLDFKSQCAFVFALSMQLPMYLQQNSLYTLDTFIAFHGYYFGVSVPFSLVSCTVPFF